MIARFFIRILRCEKFFPKNAKDVILNVILIFINMKIIATMFFNCIYKSDSRHNSHFLTFFWLSRFSIFFLHIIRRKNTYKNIEKICRLRRTSVLLNPIVCNIERLKGSPISFYFLSALCSRLRFALCANVFIDYRVKDRFPGRIITCSVLAANSSVFALNSMM